MKDSLLSDRMGAIFSKSLSPCCSEILFKWAPRGLGDVQICKYCNNSLRAIKANEFYDSSYSGSMLETASFLKKERNVHLSSTWFSKSLFPTVDDCKDFLYKRCIEFTKCKEHSEFFEFDGVDCIPDSERVVFVSKGVIGVVGLEKESMSSGSMSDAGSLHPSQGDEDETTEEDDMESIFAKGTSCEDLVNRFF